MKEVFLKDSSIYMIDDKRLTVVSDSESEEMEISDYDFEIKPSKVFIKEELYFLNNKSLYKFNLEEEKSIKIIDFEERSEIFISDSIYQVIYEDRLISIKKYDFNKNLIEERSFNFDKKIDATIEENNLFMSDLWEDEDSTLLSNDKVRDFIISEIGNFALIVDNQILFGKLSNNSYQIINLPATNNMELSLSLNNAVATIDAKDGESSFTFTLELPLKRVRRGAVLKQSINILKRGIDQITPYISKNGKFWLGVDGESSFYPLLVNLKTLSPVAIFDEPVTNDFRITATKDLSDIIVTDFNIIRKYSWKDEGLIAEYEVEL